MNVALWDKHCIKMVLDDFGLELVLFKCLQIWQDTERHLKG